MIIIVVGIICFILGIIAKSIYWDKTECIECRYRKRCNGCIYD